MATNGLNPRYFVSLGLEDYLVNPDTGLPLSNGYIQCYIDTQRTTPKPVCQLSGNPPNYTYETLPNPVPLSATGNPMNANGDIVKIYYYPWDADLNLELYYLKIYDENDVLKYEIQATPNLTQLDNPTFGTSVYENQLSNPQFVEIAFQESLGMSINIDGAVSDQEYDVAPNWVAVVSTSGTSNLIFNRVALEGALNVPTNAPYVLEVQASGSISKLQLKQKLSNNPDIWSSTTSETGYVAGTFLTSSLDGLPHTVSMYYSPSSAPAPQIIITGTTGVSGYKQLSGTIELTAGESSQDGNLGYVDIVIDLPVNCHIYLSSLQVVGLPFLIDNVLYSQETANRQRDHLFNYYEEPLKFKPISSYLVGWDFSLNPAQFGNTGSMGALGSNTSRYIWDQTIGFQSTTNSYSFLRSSLGGLRFDVTADTQPAIIQYLDGATLKDIFINDLSVNVCLSQASVPANSVGTVSLWYTADGSLPAIGSSISVVGSLDENGYPTSFNGAWTEIPRANSLNAEFEVQNVDNELIDFGFSGWSTADVVDATTNGVYFAIVVGFSQLTTGSSITFQSVSLVPGDIPTRPAPQTYDEVFRECQYYWETSYKNQQTGATYTGAQWSPATIIYASSTQGSVYERVFEVQYKQEKRAIPLFYTISPTIPASGGGLNIECRENATSFPVPSTGSNPAIVALANEFFQISSSTSSVAYANTNVAPVMIFGGIAAFIPSASFSIVFHYVANAQLGVV